jgi:hypothetical protein
MISVGPGKTLMNILAHDAEIYNPREWLIKILQNASLFAHGATKKSNPKLSKRLQNLSFSARDARMSYSPFKCFKDYTIIRDYLKNPKLTPITPQNKVVNYLNYSMMGAHFSYVLFENIAFYMRVKATKTDKSKFYSKLFCSFWVVYIILVCNRKYYDLKHFVPSGDEKKDELKKKILKIQIVSNLCDIFTSAGGAGIPALLTGKNFPETLRGLGGTMAAITNLWAYKLNQKL